MQSLPSFNALRAFESAARHLSFSKAAEELNVTPAAISHLIRALEQQLGVELFHRLNKGVALTDAAEQGQGVALTLEALAADAIAEGRLVTPFDIRLPVKSAYYLISLEKTAGVRRISLFRKWILEEAVRFKRRFPEPAFG